MHYDVLIIGAGINGLLSAWLLAREGLRVGIVERGEAARESTWAGAGILSPLMPWDYGGEVNVLSERGRALWPAWIEAIGQSSAIDPEYRSCGMLALSLAEETPAWLDDLLGKGPGGLWLPDIAQVRNPRLAKALVEACLAAGVRLLVATNASRWDIQGNTVRSLETSKGKLIADRHVISAGAWSRQLLSESVGEVDVRPVRGQILLFQAKPGLLPCILYKAGRYLVPRQDGLILAGSTLEHAGFDKSTTQAARDELLAFALDALPSLRDTPLVRQWAGLRPGSTDNIPTISAHPRLDNLYINSGQYRYGVTMAPASAELLRDLILNREPVIDPGPYRWSLG
jgi:glycine oxidase